MGGTIFSSDPVKILNNLPAFSVSSATTILVPGLATLIISSIAFFLSGNRFIAPRWNTTSNFSSLKGRSSASALYNAASIFHF